MVNLSLCCAYFVGMDAAVKDEASHFSNVKVLSTDAKGDVAKLTSDVEDLLNQSVDGLIISRRLDRSGTRRAQRHQAGRRAGRHGRSAAQGRRLHAAGSGPTTARSARASATTSSSASNGKGKVADHPRRPGRQHDRFRPLGRRAVEVEAAEIQAVVAPAVAAGAPTAASSRWRTCSPRRRTSTPCSARTTPCASVRRRRSRTPARRSEIFIASVDGEMGTLKEIMREGINYGATGL